MVSTILDRARGYLALGIPHEALEELAALPSNFEMRGEVLTLLALISLALESPERAADFAALGRGARALAPGRQGGGGAGV